MCQSARSNERQKIDALDTDTDDYLTKLFGLGELLALIRVALRHASRPAEHTRDDVFIVDALKVG